MTGVDYALAVAAFVIAAAAMDQRGSLQKSLAKEKGGEVGDAMMEEFKSLVTEVLTPHASAILLAGALAVSAGGLTVGGLVAFVSYLLILVFPIEELAWILAMAEEAETAAGRVWEVFDTEPFITDRPNAITLLRARGDVHFDGVHFSYPTSNYVVLDGLETAHPGFRERLFDDQGELRRFVNVFVDDEDIRFLDGVNTEVKDGATVSIVPAVAGG